MALPPIMDALAEGVSVEDTSLIRLRLDGPAMAALSGSTKINVHDGVPESISIIADGLADIEPDEFSPAFNSVPKVNPAANRPVSTAKSDLALQLPIRQSDRPLS